MAEIKLMGKRDVETDYAQNIRQLSDEDYNRVAYWAANKFFPQGIAVPGIAAVPDIPEVLAQDAVLDENGNVLIPAVAYQPAVPGTPEVPPSVRPPDGTEIFQALTDSIYEQIKREAEAWYLVQAEAQARASVPPIVLVPAN